MLFDYKDYDPTGEERRGLFMDLRDSETEIFRDSIDEEEEEEEGDITNDIMDIMAICQHTN